MNTLDVLDILSLRHPGRARHRALLATGLALILALSGHALLFLSFHLWAALAPAGRLSRQAPKQEKADEPSFILVPDEEDDPERPENPVAEAAFRRRARQADPIEKLPKGSPTSKGRSPVLHPTPPSPASAAGIPRPPAPRLQRARPQPQKQPQPRKQTKQESKPSPIEPPERGLAEKLRAFAPDIEPQPEDASARPSPQRRAPPPVKRVGSKSSTPSPMSKRNRTSARLKGNRSFDVLKARYGMYMNEVLRRLQQAVAIEKQVAPMTFDQGIVVVTFRISPEGRVEDITVVESDPPDMTTERVIAREVLEIVQKGEPLPKPTEKMLADPEFRKIEIGIFFVPY